jgi:hypothetical protein
VTDTKETIIVEKNRQRAFWALAIIGFVFLISIVLLVTGLLNNKGIIWPLVGLGTVGVIGFGASALRIISTMRSPWNLTLDPTRLMLRTQTYTISVPWENIASIGVAEVNFRPGCVLVLEDAAAAVKATRFHARSNRSTIITDADGMLARMEENFENLGYHLGIPGRVLEKGPKELAELLTEARTGELWIDSVDN